MRYERLSEAEKARHPSSQLKHQINFIIGGIIIAPCAIRRREYSFFVGLQMEQGRGNIALNCQTLSMRV